MGGVLMGLFNKVKKMFSKPKDKEEERVVEKYDEGLKKSRVCI